MARFILALLFAAASVTACQDDGPVSDPGAVQLRVVVGGFDIDTLHYSVDPDGPDGDIDVSGPESSVAAHIGGIPAGSGYTIHLTATSRDGELECEGTSVPFDVAAGETTAIGTVTVNCSPVDTGTTTSTDSSSTSTDSSAGGVDATIEFNVKPHLNTITASLTSVPVGSSTTLTVAATDDDGDSLSIDWSEGGVTWASGSSVDYLCTDVGGHTFSVAISDASSSVSGSISIECI